MNTKKKNLDDLIFESRNKDYGAYANRRNYPRYLVWALIAATTLFFVGISVPLIANYISVRTDRGDGGYSISDTLTPYDPFKDEPEEVDIPKQKASEPTVQRIVVVDDTTDVEDDPFALFEDAKNKNIGDTAGRTGDTADTRQVVVVDDPKPKETFLVVEEMPEFPGGDAGRRIFLKENMHYPQMAREIGIEGRVFVSFVVDEAGRVVEQELLRGIGGGCDEEALRVVGIMPKWKPGRQNGKEVRVRFSMPLIFTLR
jgi:periplasmic protein TonB